MVFVPLLWLAHSYQHGGRAGSFEDAMHDWSHFFTDWRDWVAALALVIPADLASYVDGGAMPLMFGGSSVDAASNVPHIIPHEQERLLDLAFVPGGMQLSTAVSMGIGAFIRGPLPDEPGIFAREAALLSLADEENDADAAYELGSLYLDQRNFPRSLHYFELATRLGKEQAAYCAACLILQLNIDRRDRTQLERALYLLEFEESRGDTRGRHNLALVRHWLYPHDQSLRARLERIVAEAERAEEAKNNERLDMLAISESGRAEREAELERARKAEKRAREARAAQQSQAKTAAYVAQQQLRREDALRYAATTPPPTLDDLDDLDGLLADLEDPSGASGLPENLLRYSPLSGSTLQYFGIDDDFADLEVRDLSGQLLRHAQPERRSPAPFLQVDSLNARDRSQVQSGAARASAPCRGRGTSAPCRGRGAAGAPRRGRGRPKGSLDSGPRVKRSEKGAGRPRGSKDSQPRKTKRSTNAPETEGNERRVLRPRAPMPNQGSNAYAEPSESEWSESS
jgi:hypothetical protein